MVLHSIFSPVHTMQEMGGMKVSLPGGVPSLCSCGEHATQFSQIGLI